MTHDPTKLADDLVWALKSALRFAASRAAITADEERGILAALASQDAPSAEREERWLGGLPAEPVPPRPNPRVHHGAKKPDGDMA